MGVQHGKRYGDELIQTKEAEGKTFFGTIPQEESIRLKKLGFIQNRGTDKFNCNVITRSGRIGVGELQAITDIAQEYGNGEVALTGGATIEILGIPYNQVAGVIQACKEKGIEIGGTGAKVRPAITCQGEMCRFGVIDSHELAEKIKQLFYRRLGQEELPNKFEIAVSACPSNCIGADVYDLGIVGIRIPKYDAALCRGCKSCAIDRICPEGAAKVTEGKLRFYKGSCNHCGLCIEQCPFGAVKETTVGYRVYIGGSRGKLTQKGYSFHGIITNEEAVLSVIDRLIHLYQKEGQPGEWFVETVNRIGAESIEERVLG